MTFKDKQETIWAFSLVHPTFTRSPRSRADTPPRFCQSVLITVEGPIFMLYLVVVPKYSSASTTALRVTIAPFVGGGYVN